ncbi:PDZ domain-containing protein [Pseudenhygromyxa sp. WMMC2535]|uniref:PDZ domain-containing protein n=1 Tax=Pseudenhygromyxa sp. WMMC2535 TaxID=2712867 RepID=UPI0015542499|nr:PDZ domain-containing protein [Pseudenhygromyxa sp. WMMC2535]NVB36461.1 PDZ domain-containing protein [Pseudenhygromyxa sp. WMMC2535]
MSVFQREVPLLLASFSALLALSSCGEKNGSGNDEAGELIDQVCNMDCDHPKQCLRRTKDNPGPDDWKVVSAFCADSIYSLENLSLPEREFEMRKKCRVQDGGVHDPNEYETQDLPCSTSAKVDCSDWDWKSVVLSNDDEVTKIEGQALLLLFDNPSPLAACDTTRFLPLDDEGGFEVVDVSEGDLAYTLGLRSGDRIINFDGQEIIDYDDAMGGLAVFSELYESEHVLQVERNGATLNLRYEVVR